MHLRQILGQLFIFGFRGSQLAASDPLYPAISQHSLGGVILFADNIESPAQLRALTTQLQRLQTEPLLISVDQEGGSVARLSSENGFENFAAAPIPAKTLGTQNDLAATYEAAKETAALLASYGINLNFAPVVDIDNAQCPVIGARGRAFSDNPEVVSAHAQQVLTAFNEAGLLGCLKHFPGHGSSLHDTHLAATDITDTWQASELLPYQQLLGTFDGMVMAGHLVNHTLDSTALPATLSHAMITGLLREQLNYNGVVIADDLQMKAAADHYTLSEALILSINAGVDMFIFGNQLDYQPDLYEEVMGALEKAVREGDIPEARITEAHQRVMTLKQKNKKTLCLSI